MRSFVKVCGVVCAALLLGCNGDDHGLDVGDAAPLGDGGRDATAVDATADGGPADGGATDSAVPRRLLVTTNNVSTSEIVALNLETSAVDGRLTFPGFLGTTYAAGDSVFVLEQASSVVARLDPKEPWKITSSWDVLLNDEPDGGSSYADPYASIVVTPTKAYVLRYTRNRIAVIDPSEVADGGAPRSTIDLSGLVQPDDGDGLVDMAMGFYSAAHNRVYVLLANYDKTKVIDNGFTLLCSNTEETLIAIDPATDTVVSLTDAGPSGGFPLVGMNPAIGLAGVGAVYDAVNDRLLVLHDGCNAPLGDGGGGAMARRNVEALNLATGASTVLLDLNAQEFPGAIAYMDQTHAAIGFGFSPGHVYNWDSTGSTLGAEILNAPDPYTFVMDFAKARLLGTKSTYLSDGGMTLDIIATQIADGGVTTLATNPFTDNTGFVGGITLWP